LSRRTLSIAFVFGAAFHGIRINAPDRAASVHRRICFNEGGKRNRHVIGVCVCVYVRMYIPMYRFDFPSLEVKTTEMHK